MGCLSAESVRTVMLSSHAKGWLEMAQALGPAGVGGGQAGQPPTQLPYKDMYKRGDGTN